MIDGVLESALMAYSETRVSRFNNPLDTGSRDDLTQILPRRENETNHGPQMCREPCLRAKPSDGLEPSTPSLPWRFRGGAGGHGRALAATLSLQVAHFGVRARSRERTPRDGLMYPSGTHVRSRYDAACTEPEQCVRPGRERARFLALCSPRYSGRSRSDPRKALLESSGRV
jgi:hypothetical protein